MTADKQQPSESSSSSSSTQSTNVEFKTSRSRLTHSIPKLSLASNYTRWRNRMLTYLEAVDLDHVITKPTDKIIGASDYNDLNRSLSLSPAELQSLMADDKNGINKDTRDVYLILTSALAEDVSDIIDSCTRGNAYEVWLKIEELFIDKTPANFITLKQDLEIIRLDNVVKFEDYYTKLTKVFLQLKAIDHTMKNHEMVWHLCKGLPPSLNDVRRNIEMDIMNYSYDMAVQKIKFYIKRENIYNRANDSSSSSPKSESAMYSKQKFKNKLNIKNKSHQSNHNINKKPHKYQDRECTTCGNTGHIAYMCFKNINNPNIKRCHNCKQINHDVSECKYPIKDQFKNNSSNTSNNHRHQNRNDNNHHANNRKRDASLVVEESCYSANDKHYSKCWILDSGASRHFVNNYRLLQNIRQVDPIVVSTANNCEIITTTVGDVKIKSNGVFDNVILRNVAYVPEFKTNLLSISSIFEQGSVPKFYPNYCLIMKNNELVLKVPKVGKLYIFSEHPTYLEIETADAALLSSSAESEHESDSEQKYDLQDTNSKDVVNDTADELNLELQLNLDETEHAEDAELWHKRLGHLSTSSMKSLIRNNAVDGLNITNHDLKKQCLCETCQYAKMHKSPFNSKASEPATQILDRVHSDLCGPIPVPTFTDKRYLCTIIDEKSRYTFGFLLGAKSEAPETIRHWHKEVTNQTGVTLKEFHSDSGGEFINKELEQYFKEHGVKQSTTTTATPQNNGVAERMNRTLFDMVRSLLFNADLPQQFWGEAVMTAIYIRNR